MKDKLIVSRFLVLHTWLLLLSWALGKVLASWVSVTNQETYIWHLQPKDCTRIQIPSQPVFISGKSLDWFCNTSFSNLHFFLYVWVFWLCVCLCTTCIQWLWIPWNCSCRTLWAVRWVLGLKSRSSGRAIIVLCHWVLTVATGFTFRKGFLSKGVERHTPSVGRFHTCSWVLVSDPRIQIAGWTAESWSQAREVYQVWEEIVTHSIVSVCLNDDLTLLFPPQYPMSKSLIFVS